MLPVADEFSLDRSALGAPGIRQPTPQAGFHPVRSYRNRCSIPRASVRLPPVSCGHLSERLRPDEIVTFDHETALLKDRLPLLAITDVWFPEETELLLSCR
jgi:hypothetical protein